MLAWGRGEGWKCRAWKLTANIAYPRELLERTGGFDESLPVAAGEDTDLLERCKALGAAYVAAPDAPTWHAVFDLSLLILHECVAPAWAQLCAVGPLTLDSACAWKRGPAVQRFS